MDVSKEKRLRFLSAKQQRWQEMGFKGQDWDLEVRKPLSLYSERFLYANHRRYIWEPLIHATKIHILEYRMSFVLLIWRFVFKFNLRNLNL